MGHKWMLGFMMLILIPIAYAIQVNSSTLIYSFDVTNCQANETTIGCAPVSVRFSCNISNYAYIDYTLFRLNGSDHPAQRASEIFYYDWNKSTTPIDLDTNFAFDRGQIHDIGGGDALFFPNVSVRILCDSCGYNVTYDACQINNTRIAHYVGDGSLNCTSYNDTESCDYCEVDWQRNSTCLENNSEFRQYQDNNNCYGITGLYSDSCGYSFIDCDTWKPCKYQRGLQLRVLCHAGWSYYPDQSSNENIFNGHHCPKARD
jgi:hypothetical protein